MNWLPTIAQCVAAALLLVLTTYVVLRRPPDPLWPDLAWFQLLALSFVVGDVVTLHATTMGQKDVGLVFVHLGVFGGSAYWLRVSLAVLWLRRSEVRWIPFVRRLVGVWAVLVVLFAGTNVLHRWFLLPRIGERNVYLLPWWVATVASWVLLLASGAVFLFLLLDALRQKDRDRREVTNASLLLAAGLVPMAANLFWVFGKGLVLDPSAAGLGVGCLILTWGVYRTRVFDILPVSHREVLNLDPEAILICSGSGKIGFANPAASILLAEVSGRDALVGQDMHEVLDVLFGESSVVVPFRPDKMSSDADRNALLALDSRQRLLRIEAFFLASSRSKSPTVAYRVRDVSIEETRRRNRILLARRLEGRLQGLVDPAIQASDRVLAMLSGAPDTDLRLKQQARTVRSLLSDLKTKIGEALSANV